MKDRTLTLDTPDGPMNAYLALPDGAGPHPALVVAQEAFGVNDHIKDVCRRLAAEGYVALAPELYHRQGSGITVEYSDLPAAIGYLKQVDNDGLTADVNAALAHLRSMPEVNAEQAGIIGFCMGGFVAFLAACRTDVAASVVFYGGGLIHPRPGFKITPLLPEAERIEAPLLGHFAAEDATISTADVDTLRDALQDLYKEHEILVYPGVHGFFCDKRPSYNAESAAKAWAKTVEWLRDVFPRPGDPDKQVHEV